MQCFNASIPENICFLGIKDIPALVNLEKQCFSCPWSEQELRLSLGQDSFYALGLLKEDLLVAYLSFYLVVDEMEIVNIAVDNKFRRKGIGSILLQAGLDFASKNGVNTVFLEVRPSNHSALALYNKFYFKLKGRRLRYYPDTGEDALLMSLTLKA